VTSIYSIIINKTIPLNIFLEKVYNSSKITFELLWNGQQHPHFCQLKRKLASHIDQLVFSQFLSQDSDCIYEGKATTGSDKVSFAANCFVDISANSNTSN